MFAPNRTLLDEALELWRYAREDAIEQAESIGADAFDSPPADAARAPAALVRHIVASGLMAAGELTRPDGDFQRRPYPDLVNEYAGHVEAVRDRAALLDLMRTSWTETASRFTDAGELFLLGPIRRFDGRQCTRLAWIWHALDHESYHRGQLALYVRLSGGIPALTRHIMGAG